MKILSIIKWLFGLVVGLIALILLTIKPKQTSEADNFKKFSEDTQREILKNYVEKD